MMGETEIGHGKTNSPPTMSGAILVDKPSGTSSARAVAMVKRLLPKKTKVGHTGTLDPLASGLLIIVVGKATRLSRYVTDMEKSYAATARLGATSTTLDAEGDILELEAPIPTENSIRAALPNFTGCIKQLPPMASAVKVGGERLYKLHREGVEVEREEREVEIHAFDLVSMDESENEAAFHISCGSGTYVRSLASDLAESLGSGAYLTALRRTAVGHFEAEKSASPENLDESTIKNHIIPMTKMVSHLPAVEVGDEVAASVANGRSMEVSEDMAGSFRVEGGGELLAVYEAGGGVARPEVVLCAS
ncbi:MAG: tRNA pseudouridine(55) synthase TruB [Actinomycetota bacterium]|jgi:tRNA pseudouridine55 synthase|nr:tRNA pseudouridine(55) synthase TruB [Actinomycetota bacterium]